VSRDSPSEAFADIEKFEGCGLSAKVRDRKKREEKIGCAPAAFIKERAFES